MPSAFNTFRIFRALIQFIASNNLPLDQEWLLLWQIEHSGMCQLIFLWAHWEHQRDDSRLDFSVTKGSCRGAGSPSASWFHIEVSICNFETCTSQGQSVAFERLVTGTASPQDSLGKMMSHIQKSSILDNLNFSSKMPKVSKVRIRFKPKIIYFVVRPCKPTTN